MPFLPFKSRVTKCNSFIPIYFFPAHFEDTGPDLLQCVGFYAYSAKNLGINIGIK